MKNTILLIIFTFIFTDLTGQITQSVVFELDKKANITKELDSVIVYRNVNNEYEFEKNLKNIKLPLVYKVAQNQVYQFIFYHSCCSPYYKVISTDTLKNNEIVLIDFGERLIKLKELEVKAQRDRYSQSGDTLFIFTNPDDTRPHASAATLFNRITGLSNDLGRISILGKAVREVTIDGRKIFGGLPSLSLEAIKAEMIEQMEFIEKTLPSGQTVNTLNIKLKKESKNLGYGTVDLAEASQNNYLVSGRFNKISKAGFLNAFVTANSINQRGIDPKTLDYLRMNAFGDAMNTTGSVIGLYDNAQTETEDNFSAFEAKLLGTNKYADAGLNYTLTKTKLELNSFVFVNQLNGFINQNTNSQTLLGDLNLQTTKLQKQSNSESSLNSNINLTYKISPKVTFRFSDFINISKGSRFWEDSTENISSFNQFPTTVNGILNSNNNIIENLFNSSLIITGKKPGTLTSLLVNHRHVNIQNENNFENIISLNDIDSKKIGWQSSNPLLNTGKIQINHAKPVNKRLLLETKFKYTYTSNSNNLIDLKDQKNQALINVSENNKLLETGIYALYQKKKFKAISGIDYLNWKIHRFLNENSLDKSHDFIISPFTKIETKINKSLLWLRYSTEVNLPTWNQVGSLPDSSNLNLISNGNIFLSRYIQRNLQLGSSISFKNGLQTNLSLGYSRFVNAIVGDNQTNPALNIVSNSFINSPIPNESININFRIFRIKMNSKFSVFYFSNFIHLKSYQKTNDSFSSLKTNLLFNNITATYKLHKNVIFKLTWASRLNELNGELIFNNDILISNSLELGKKWYIDSKLNTILNNNLNSNPNTQNYLDIELGKYMLKKNNFKGSLFVKNAFDIRNQITSFQSTNFQTILRINQLPRIIGFQITVYPETFW